MKKRMILGVPVIVIAVAATIVGYIILPDVLTLQITATGDGGTRAPKLLGLLVPLALSSVFSFIYIKNDGLKNLLIATLGLVMFGLTFFVNL